MAIHVNKDNFAVSITKDLKSKVRFNDQVFHKVRKAVMFPFLNVCKKYVEVGVSAALKNSGRVVEKAYTGSKLIFGIVFGGFAAKYAYYHHEGTKPHYVPKWVILGPLYDWVMKKIVRGKGGRNFRNEYKAKAKMLSQLRSGFNKAHKKIKAAFSKNPAKYGKVKKNRSAKAKIKAQRKAYVKRRAQQQVVRQEKAGAYESHARSLSWMIGKKIQVNGTKANPFMDKAFNDYDDTMRDRITKILLKNVRDNVK